MEHIKGKLIKQGGVKCEDINTDGMDFVGLYFSAHWCPPCKGFTPVFAEYYQKWKKADKNFEVVFISSDKDEGQFKEYFKEMPWLALDFNEREAKGKLTEKFGIRGIPTLIILNPDGNLNQTNGREMVRSGTYFTDFTQQKK